MVAEVWRDVGSHLSLTFEYCGQHLNGWSGTSGVEQRLQGVRENSSPEAAVEQSSQLLAAKRRKNGAHGVSRGSKWEMRKPHRGERKVLTHILQPLHSVNDSKGGF